MGKCLVQSACDNNNHASHTNQVQLAAALVPEDSALIGTDIGLEVLNQSLNIKCTNDFNAVVNDFDVLIDFTRPDVSLHYLALCRQHNKALVLGTTGFTEAQRLQIEQAAEDIPIVYAPNMSIGVNLLLGLVDQMGRVIGNQADIEIIEAHHKHKKDAPSGTALAIGEAIAKAQGSTLEEKAVYSRHGRDIGERQPGSIGFATIRAGDIVGEHTALFALANERLEITHKASSRRAFADGAIYAAAWLNKNQHEKGKNGVFSMQQVLGF